MAFSIAGPASLLLSMVATYASNEKQRKTTCKLRSLASLPPELK